MLAHRAYRFRNFVFVRQDSESFRQAVMRCSSKTQQQSFAAGGRSFARRFFYCQKFFHRTEFSLGKDGIEVRKHVQRKAALQKPAQRNLTCPFKQPLRVFAGIDPQGKSNNKARPQSISNPSAPKYRGFKRSPPQEAEDQSLSFSV